MRTRRSKMVRAGACVAIAVDVVGRTAIATIAYLNYFWVEPGPAARYSVRVNHRPESEPILDYDSLLLLLRNICTIPS